MATVKATYRKEKVLKDGTYPIVVRVSHQDSIKYIGIKESTTPEQWNDAKGEANGRHPHRIRINKKIHVIVSNVQQAIDQCIIERKEFNIHALDTVKNDTLRNNLFTFSVKLLDIYRANNQGGTFRKAQSHINKLSKFIGTNRFPVAAFNSDFLMKYVQHLRNELQNSENTIFANLKTLKAVYTLASKEVVNLENPFENLKVVQTVPKRAKLSIDEIYSLMDVKLAPIQALWRDLFIFSFFCWGMRFRDVLLLSHSNVEGEILSYTTSKSSNTKRITLRMNEYSQQVVKRHGSTSGNRLFPILAEEKDALKLERMIAGKNVVANRSLKVALLRAKIDKDGVTFHTARHSFVDVMKQGGVPIEMRMQMVGHTSESVHKRYHDDYGSEVMSAAVQGVLKGSPEQD